MFKKQILLIFAIYLIYFYYEKHYLLQIQQKDPVVTFFDVGQGDSILVRYRGRSVLIDGGANDDASYYLGQYFYYPGCYLDYVFLTHPDFDHMYGLLDILKLCKINLVTFNDVDYSSDTFSDFRSYLSNKLQINKVSPNIYHGNKFNIEDLHIYILWPSPDIVSNYKSGKSTNDISTVLLFDRGDFEILLTGDAEADVISQIDWKFYMKYIQNGLDVLKVPHHGSKNSLSKPIMSLLGPVSCVLSVGKNSYGHPSPTALSLLARGGCRIRRTDKEGNIEFVMR